ncbi:TetR/AcrR family transcriptional regulator [Brevibacterium yomogidense]
MYRQTDATRQNAVQRERAIAEAARALVTESGFASATIKSVAARAGCSAGLIYSYFPDRDALLRSAFTHASGHELAAVTRALEDAPTTAEAVAALVDTFLTRAFAGARLADALLFEALPPAVEAERLHFRAGYAAAIARRLRREEAPPLPAQDTSLTARALVGALSGCLQEPIHDSGRTRFDPAEVQALVHRMTGFCLAAVGFASLHSP